MVRGPHQMAAGLYMESVGVTPGDVFPPTLIWPSPVDRTAARASEERLLLVVNTRRGRVAVGCGHTVQEEEGLLLYKEKRYPE
jgi:hypothetical protein